MTPYILTKYLHIFALMILVGGLVTEHIMLRSSLPASTMKKLAIIDGIYGFASLMSLLAGLLLWFKVGKGSEFYTANPALHIKLGLFAIVGLLSIYPTLFFLKHRKTNAEFTEIPNTIVLIVRCELLLVLIIPLFAVMVAQGARLAV